MSLLQTIAQTTTLRASDSIIRQKLELANSRSIQANTAVSSLKSYALLSGGDSHKTDVEYIVADQGDQHTANSPYVIEYVKNAANTVLTRDTDSHHNNFVKVGTLGTGAAIDATYPKIVVFENRGVTVTTNTNSGSIVVRAMTKTSSPA